MLLEDIAECKKYAESKGFVLVHFADEVGEEDIIYMDNVKHCNNLICNFFDDVVAVHHIQFNRNVQLLRCSARSDEVETVEEFKTLLDNLVIRWKLLKQEIKLDRISEDFI